MTVDKTLLTQRLAGAPVRTVRVFIFAEALRQALIRGVSTFEAEVWASAPAPMVIAILDTDINLMGPHLAILGSNSLAELPAVAAQPAPNADFLQSRRSATNTSAGTGSGSGPNPLAF